MIMKKTFETLFRREVMQKDKGSVKRNCQFFQDSGVPDNGGVIGCCKLEEQTKCFGDLQFCKNPEALREYFSERGLGWGERRRPERPRLIGGVPDRELSVSSVSHPIIEYIRNLTQPLLIAIALLITICVGVLNRLTGPEFSSSIFYLIPISMVTWFTNRWVGILMSIIGAIDLAYNGCCLRNCLPIFYCSLLERIGKIRFLSYFYFDFGGTQKGIRE